MKFPSLMLAVFLTPILFFGTGCVRHCESYVLEERNVDMLCIGIQPTDEANGLIGESVPAIPELTSDICGRVFADWAGDKEKVGVAYTVVGVRNRIKQGYGREATVASVQLFTEKGGLSCSNKICVIGDEPVHVRLSPDFVVVIERRGRRWIALSGIRSNGTNVVNGYQVLPNKQRSE